jgi:hypothetical protein
VIKVQARRTTVPSFAQIVVAISGVSYSLTGLALLGVPGWFFANIGHFAPFNRHYEGDLGAFLLPLGLGLLAAARAPARHSALLAVATAGSLIHAANHLYDIAIGTTALDRALVDSGPLVLLALLLVVVLVQVGREPSNSD